MTTHRTRVVELSSAHRLPAMYGFRELVEVGGLIRSENPRLVPRVTSDFARRRSLLVAAAAGLLLAGCFPAVASFSKPGVSEEQYARDRYVCMRKSRVRDLVGGEEETTLHGDNRLARREADRLFEACMTARGYKRVE